MASAWGVRGYFFAPTPFVPVEPSKSPAAAKLKLTTDYDEPHKDSRGEPMRQVGVILENQGEDLIQCVYVALSVFDEAGIQHRNYRQPIGCQADAFLWPKDTGVAWFDFPDLDKTERYDLVIEKVETGAPAVAAPPASPLAISVNPRVGLEDVSPFLSHTLRASRYGYYEKFADQSLLIAITAANDYEVTDLQYELRVYDAAGNVVEKGYALVAASSGGYVRIPALKPGQTRVFRISTHIKAPTREPMRWEVVVERFAGRKVTAP
jgi:hypothetical protein